MNTNRTILNNMDLRIWSLLQHGNLSFVYTEETLAIVFLAGAETGYEGSRDFLILAITPEPA